MPKPKLSLDTIRLHQSPVYSGKGIVGFSSDGPPEVVGTLYLSGGGTMKLWQPLTEEEQMQFEALLERVSKRILSAMTAALSPEEVQGPDDA